MRFMVFYWCESRDWLRQYCWELNCSEWLMYSFNFLYWGLVWNILKCGPREIEEVGATKKWWLSKIGVVAPCWWWPPKCCKRNYLIDRRKRNRATIARWFFVPLGFPLEISCFSLCMIVLCVMALMCWFLM